MITRDDCATFGFPTLDRQVTITSDGLLTVAEVCLALRIERHTVYKLIDNGILPTVPITQRIRYIRAEAVQKILDPPAR